MAHYFSNASHTIINNPTITHVNGNASYGISEREGLRLLLNNISNGAFHDAADRGDPPKCHPDTRVAIREEITEWIKASEARRKFILWMYGPAGSGKTAIAQSIAEECKKRGLLAASFFFSRTALGRNDMTRVVATIAYQISRFVPQVENSLFVAIERDPTIFSRALATQIQVLVIEPLNSVLLVPLSGPVFVVLDGLDESGPNARAQADLLNTIGMAISELQHIPLLFLIASRPEYEIREAFAQPFLQSFMRPLELNNQYNPDADIELYFNSTFRQIHDKHLRLGAHLPSLWPSDSDVNRLVSKASGQFIFAATVLRFIDSIHHHPAKRLNIILGLLAAGNERPFALLDALYHHILSSVASLSQVLEILTLLILKADVRNPPDLTVGWIEDLLGIEVRRALVDMHALVFVPSADNVGIVHIYHASLYDFLMDRSRSHDYYIGKNQGHITLSRRWLKAIGNHQISTRISFPKRIEIFNYHCRNSPVTDEIAADLAHLNLKAPLDEVYTDFARKIQTTKWMEFFDCVKTKSQKRTDILARLQGEFLAYFIEHLSKYPPTLQASIPTILALSGNINSGNIFYTLLYAVCRSQEEIDETLKLDSTLLNLCSIYGLDNIFCQLFEDHSLAGPFYVHSGSYLALAKKIVGVVFPMPGEHSQNVEFQRTFRRLDEVKTINVQVSFERWVNTMLSKASMDIDLAQILRDHALQYRDDLPHSKIEMEPLALASLAYVLRCGLPHLKHTHLEGTNKCVVCDKYRTIVIDPHPSESKSYPKVPNASDKPRVSICSRLRSFKFGRR